MKFILMMNTPRDGYEQYMKWPKDVLEANMAFMHAFAAKLSAAGELVSTVGLAAPTRAKFVRAGKDGKPITDGVFPESKEFLSGYWIVDVDSEERAYQLAAEVLKAPHGPMSAGQGFEFGVEVRQVIGGAKELT